MPNERRKKFRAITNRNERKKKAEVFKQKFCDCNIPFKILDDTNRLELITKVKETTKNRLINEEEEFSSLTEVSESIENYMGAPSLKEQFVFSNTDYSKEPFFIISFKDWESILLKLLPIYGQDLRVYNNQNFTSASIEYNKFDENFILDYSFWELSHSIEDMEIEEYAIKKLR